MGTHEDGESEDRRHHQPKRLERGAWLLDYLRGMKLSAAEFMQ